MNERNAASKRREVEQDWRQRLLKSNLSLPAAACEPRRRRLPTRTITAAPAAPQPTHSGGAEYLSVKGTLHQRLLDELDRRNLLGGERGDVDRIRRRRSSMKPSRSRTCR